MNEPRSTKPVLGSTESSTSSKPAGVYDVKDSSGGSANKAEIYDRPERTGLSTAKIIGFVVLAIILAVIIAQFIF